MNLSLSNMLSNGGSLNADGLSLDLAFALDKTLTARKGPTPTFSRATTATFVGSDGLIQTAGINEARFDHDPVTLVCKGLLIEFQRTNVLLNSDALSTQNVTLPAGVRTLSFYGTGTIVLSGGHIATVVGTGAYPARTTLTFTPTVGTLTLTVTGSVEFAQLEEGAFPTSYIPTTTTALTRGREFCSITGSDFTNFYNLSGGTIVTETSNNGDVTYVRSVAVTIGVAGNRVQLGVTNLPGLAIRPFIVAGGLVTYSATQGTATVGAPRKVALAFAADDAISCFNGTLGTQDNSVTLPTSVSVATIGSDLSGHFSRLQYFRKRLSNEKLQTLTT